MKLSLLALSLVALWPCAAQPQDPPVPPAATQDAPTHTVAKGTLVLAIDAEGTLDAVTPQEVRLRPKAHQGELTIQAIAASGTAVKKGDVILAIDATALRKQVAAAENDYEAARANFRKAEVDAQLSEQADLLAMKGQDHDLKNAEAVMKYWDAIDGPHFLKRMELSIVNSRDNIADQKDELDQLEKMYKSEELTNATADIVMKRSLRQYERSKAYLEMTEKEHKKEVELDYANSKQRVVAALEKAKQDMQQLKSAQDAGRVLRKTGLTSARATLDQTEEHLSDLKADLESLSVKAASDGVVLYGQLQMGQWQGNEAKLLRPGERVQPQMVLMTLFVPGKLKAIIDIAESQYFWVKAGAKALVIPTVLDELKYEATIAAISPVGMNKGPGQSFALDLSLPSVDERLVPGMKASVHLDVAELKDVVLVPAGAVSRGRVWVKGRDGKEEIRAVVSGKSDGQWTEIKSGVTVGDVVLSQAKK